MKSRASSSSRQYLRHPEVFLNTVVHWVSAGADVPPGSRLQPDCGMMTSSVSVCRPLLMTAIFNGSCEERFHKVPALTKRHGKV